MIRRTIDLAGVTVFAISGVLAAGRAQLDLLGVLVIATVSAVGGGTVRDLLMNRHPIFWMRDPVPLIVILVTALLTVSWLFFGLPIPLGALLIADAAGLALFALSSAQLAEAAKLPPIIIVLFGTLGGTAGGVIRDVLTGSVPLLLRANIYATAAILGILVYLVLHRLHVKQALAFGAGLATIFLLRMAAIAWGLNLPVFRL